MQSIINGLVPGDHVGDALLRIFVVLKSDSIAVVRSIDSARSQRELTKALEFHHLAYKVINGNVCLSLDTLQMAVSDGLFTGFDEVWITVGSPPAFDLATLPIATSDGADFTSSLPETLSRAMEKTGCVLIVGDGCGLNYATTLEEVQKIFADQ